MIYICLVWTVGNHPSAAEPENATVTDATATDADIQGSYDVRESTAILQLVYEDESGYRNIVAQENGFFIGTSESGIYFVAGRSHIMFPEEQMQAWAEGYGVERKDFVPVYEVVLRPDIRVSMEVAVESEQLDIVIFSPSESLGDVTVLRLCEDMYKNRIGDTVEVLGRNETMGGYSSMALLTDWKTIGDVHYYVHDYAVTEDTYGCPILNEDMEVIGISLFSDGMRHYALQIGELTSVCEKMGIIYNPEITVDTERLQDAVDAYEETDMKPYTEETVEQCRKYYTFALAYLEQAENGEVTYATQAEMDACAEKLQESMDSLEKKHLSAKTWILILACVCGVLFIMMLALLIILLVCRKRFRKKLSAEQEKQISAKEALKISGRVTPGEKENALSANMPLNRSFSTIQQENRFQPAETSVLGSEGIQTGGHFNMQSGNHAFLLRKRTGEEIFINKNVFVLGKDADSADYTILYNANISRRHACIKSMSGNYYIQDFGTTNGTYLNGVRVEKEEMLMPGDVIMLADEEFEFTK